MSSYVQQPINTACVDGRAKSYKFSFIDIADLNIHFLT